MKIFFGILAGIIVLTGAALLVLALWDIQPISWKIIVRICGTIGIVCASILTLWLVKVLFFQKEGFGNKGNTNLPRG